MSTGTFKVAIKEHLYKYNVMKHVTFNTEAPHLHNCGQHLDIN